MPTVKIWTVEWDDHDWPDRTSEMVGLATTRDGAMRIVEREEPAYEGRYALPCDCKDSPELKDRPGWHVYEVDVEE